MNTSISLSDRYWSSPFANLHRVKEKTQEELEELLALLEIKPEFVYKPFQHQLACFLLCLKHPGLMLALDMGTGKSKIMLDVFSYRRRLTNETMVSKRMLVLVPRRSNLPTWGGQVRAHAPHLNYALLTEKENSAMRESIWHDKKFDVVCATYAGFLELMKTHRIVRGKKESELSHQKLDQVADLFDTVVADESSYLANPENATTRAVLYIADQIKFRYTLTGTPFNKDPLGLWSQFYFCDRGETLTRHIGVFRQLFFIQVGTRFGTSWQLRSTQQTQLHRVLCHRSIRYSEAECNTLPEKLGGLQNPIVIPIQPTQKQAQYEKQTYAELRNASKNHEFVEGAFLRLRRAASGYVTVAGEPGQFRYFDENPKLDACIDLLRDMGDRKCVVVVYYQETVSMIENRFREEEKKRLASKYVDHLPVFTYTKIVGGVSNHQAALDSFNARGGVRIMLLSTAGAMGLNLQENCSDMIIYEAPLRLDERVQVEKRIHRTGQKNKVRIYDLVAPIDAKILHAHRNSKEVLDVVLDGESSIVQ